jgi:FkbM family methyltransferase
MWLIIIHRTKVEGSHEMNKAITQISKLTDFISKEGWLKTSRYAFQRLRFLLLKEANPSSLTELISNLGWSQTSWYVLQNIQCRLFGKADPYKLTSKNARFPLICRPNTSDNDVFKQIFIKREYSCLDDISNVDLVIDCGANVGYSAVYFLNRFPDCKVICVEPDPANFEILEQNLAPYNDRVETIRSGVWSHPANLKILEEPYRDGREWAVQVRECESGEIPEMQAVDVGTLLKESGQNKISILKMDVEGAEAVVFKENYESWLSCVDNMVIELHDDSSFGKASDVVLNAVSSVKSFDLSTCRELTVFKSCD